MSDKYLFKVKKKEKFYYYTKKQFEKIFGIEYLPKLDFDTSKILKKIEKTCVKYARTGLLSKRNIWFGLYYEKEIKFHYFFDIYLKWIDRFKEFGLFAAKDLRKNTFLGEYTGNIRKYKKIIDDKNSYLFEYSIGYKKSKYTIDAREKGSIIRFVNHSKNPNIEPLSVYLDGAMHLIFRTNRFVKKDEELTYDYGSNYWKRREKPKS